MGEFENYYEMKQRERLAKEVMGRVFLYNLRIDVALDLIRIMRLKAKQQAPEDCDWIDWNGKVATWKIHEGHGVNRYETVNLLASSGDLALVGYDKIDKPGKFISYIRLEYIDEEDILAQSKYENDFIILPSIGPEEISEAQPNSIILNGICISLEATAKDKFKIPSKEIDKLSSVKELRNITGDSV